MAYTRDYGYDVHGRLLSVRDRTAAGTGGDPGAGACRVTSYVFDANWASDVADERELRRVV